MASPDTAILTWIAAHRTGWADWSARHLLVAGTSSAVLGVAVVVALVVVALRRWWSMAATVGTAVVGSFVASWALKMLIARPRPPGGLALITVGGYSMPSTDGAVTAAAALALALAFGSSPRTTRRAIGVLAALAVAVIGVVLVYLGAHWASDVLVGWGVGAVVALAAHRVVGRPTTRWLAAHAAAADPPAH